MSQRRENILKAILDVETRISLDDPPSDTLIKMKALVKLEDLQEAKRTLV